VSLSANNTQSATHIRGVGILHTARQQNDRSQTGTVRTFPLIISRLTSVTISVATLALSNFGFQQLHVRVAIDVSVPCIRELCGRLETAGATK
jgi:hypothetical protein